MKKSIRSCAAVIVVLLTSLISFVSTAKSDPLPQGELLRRSGDAYVRQAGTSWFFGTSKVEKQVQYAKGLLTLTGFRDPSVHHEYIQGAPSNIFRFDIDGEVVSSDSHGRQPSLPCTALGALATYIGLILFEWVSRAVPGQPFKQRAPCYKPRIVSPRLPTDALAVVNRNKRESLT